MKKFLQAPLAAPLAAAVLVGALLTAPLTGCGEKERRYDYFNTDIVIFVRNADGVNLCSPRSTSAAGVDHILFDAIEVEYNGTFYRLAPTSLPNDPRKRTRAIDLPRWDENGREPLRWNERMEDSSAALWFGEFSSDTKNYRGETFTIHWGGGGQKTEVKFDLHASGDKVTQAAWIKDASGQWVVSSPNSLTVNVVR